MADQNLTLHAMEIHEKLKTGELIAIRNPSSRVTSSIWDQFYLIADKYRMIVPGYVQCLKCKHLLGYKPASGNSNLTRHTTSELCRVKSMTGWKDLKDNILERALLEAGTLSHLTETSQDDDDSSQMGGQLPIKLPRKQETVTSKEEYFPSSSSSDAGPGYDPPVQHEEDSHATFVDYVFQTSAQKEIGTSRTESLEHSSSSRLENEPKPGTSNEDPSTVSIVCAPDLSAVKSPQRVETAEDPLVITMAPPPQPRLKGVSCTPVRKSLSKAVTITPKPAIASSSSTSKTSVVYFGEDPEQQTNSNIEKVLMQLRAEKLLLEMDKLKAERDKMGVEVRNIMLRRKILALRKQLFECEDYVSAKNDRGSDPDPSFQQVLMKEKKRLSELTIEAVSSKSSRITPAREGVSVQLEINPKISVESHKQIEMVKPKDVTTSRSSNKEISNTDRTIPVQNKKSGLQNFPKSQKRRTDNERSDSASTSCFPHLGSGEEIRVKVEAEDPDKLEKVGIFYESTGEGLDIDRRLSTDGFSDACGAIGSSVLAEASSFSAIESNTLAEASASSSILETRLLGAADRPWDPSVSRGGGGISDMDSSGYQNLAFKRLSGFEDRAGLHRDIPEHNVDDVIAKRRRIEDEFGLRHMDMT